MNKKGFFVSWDKLIACILALLLAALCVMTLLRTKQIRVNQQNIQTIVNILTERGIIQIPQQPRPQQPRPQIKEEKNE